MTSIERLRGVSPHLSPPLRRTETPSALEGAAAIVRVERSPIFKHSLTVAWRAAAGARDAHMLLAELGITFEHALNR
jgi:hypothetical protein